MYRFFPIFCSSVLICSHLGCGGPNSGQPVRPTRPEGDAPAAAKPVAAEPAPATPEQPTPASPPVKSVELIEADWNELQSLVGAHKGRVVVLDLWSTACEPCMKEFPHLIELQRRFADSVTAISFDLDYAGIKNKPVAYYRERVLEFLRSQPESQVLHRMSTTPADELFTALDLGSIPAIYVYGRDGKLAKRFEESDGQGAGLSYEHHVIPFVTELLK